MEFSHSDQLNELGAALSKAQGKIRGAQKDSLNPHYKSKYADLASVWDACRSALAEFGLSVIQSPSSSGNMVSVTTMLIHASGQWVKGSIQTQARDASPQSAGSAITYLRRYALSAMIGVAPDEDDDGEAAQPQKKPYEPQKKQYDRQETRYVPEPVSAPVQPPMTPAPLFDKNNAEQGLRALDYMKQMSLPEDLTFKVVDLMHGKPMTTKTLKETIATVMTQEASSVVRDDEA